MKAIFAVMMLAASLALATELPGHDPVDRVIPKTDVAAVANLVAVSIEHTKSDDLLAVTIAPSRTLWGQLPSNHVTAVYREFIPALPDKPGLSVDFMNYTGSGIEFQAKAGEEYLCFLQRKHNRLVLLRLEPVAKEAAVREQYRTLKKDAPTTPSTPTK